MKMIAVELDCYPGVAYIASHHIPDPTMRILLVTFFSVAMLALALVGGEVNPSREVLEVATLGGEVNPSREVLEVAALGGEVNPSREVLEVA